MHFSIPRAGLVLEAGKDGYVSYDVHVNGLFHCSCRYKRLLELHDVLRRHFPASVAADFPPFPPKRLLPLSDQQLEQRRSQLERYLQLGKWFVPVYFLLPWLSRGDFAECVTSAPIGT
jgi:sorting nexin-17